MARKKADQTKWQKRVEQLRAGGYRPTAYQLANARAEAMGFRSGTYKGVFLEPADMRRHLSNTPRYRKYVKSVRKVVGDRQLSPQERKTLTDFYYMRESKRTNRLTLLRWLDLTRKTPRPMTDEELDS